MRNCVLVLILCGFSIRSYLCQNSQVYTFYPSSSDVARMQQFINYLQDSFHQVPVQMQSHGKLHMQVPRQIQYEAQPGSGMISNQKQFVNKVTNANVPNVVTYFNSAQQDTKLFDGDPIVQIIKQIIGPEAGRLIQNVPTLATDQLVRIQSPGVQIQASAPQGQHLTTQFSERNSPDTTANNLKQEHRASQYQNFVAPSSEYTQPQDQQAHKITNNQYQIVSNSDQEQYTNLGKDAYHASESPNIVEPKPVDQGIHQPEQHLKYQQLSVVGNSQNSSELIPPSTESPKKPLSINRFAADLYITKKPCEICCKMNEVKPCTSCCSVTPLLSVSTLKTAVG